MNMKSMQRRLLGSVCLAAPFVVAMSLSTPAQAGETMICAPGAFFNGQTCECFEGFQGDPFEVGCFPVPTPTITVIPTSTPVDVPAIPGAAGSATVMWSLIAAFLALGGLILWARKSST